VILTTLRWQLRGAGLRAGREHCGRRLLGELWEQGQCQLLMFENAENPADVTGWLPGGGGHVLITSRERTWAEVAAPGQSACPLPGILALQDHSRRQESAHGAFRGIGSEVMTF
jgi:hypothetical protein